MNRFTGKQGRTLIVLLLIIGFVMFVYKVGDRDLWAPDEDEYAQISREMIRTNNWLVPTVAGEPWTIKPVLYNWLVSAISVPFGDANEFRARIFSALAALGAILVTFQLGKLAFTPMAGFFGALVLATNVLFLQQARWAQTYMLSTFFAVLAIYLFYRGYRREDKRTTSYLLMYAAVALGVLTMGPVNLAVPGLVVFVYLVLEKDLRHIVKMKMGWGIPLFLAIALPWYVLMGMQGASMTDLLIRSNLDRFTGSWDVHTQPFYYYLTNVPAVFLPWTVFLPMALHLAFSRRSAEDRKGLKFLLVWVVCLLLFYSASSGKRPQYIMPILPALALLIGYLGSRAMTSWQDNYFRRCVIIPSAILAVGGVVLAVALPVAAHRMLEPVFWHATGVAVIAAMFPLLYWIARKNDKPEQLLFLPVVLVGVLVLYSVHILIPRVEEFKSPRPFCEEVVKRLDNGADWAMYKFYRAAYVYYTDTFVSVLDDEEQLNEALDRPTHFLVAMREEEYEQLGAATVAKAHVIVRSKIGHRPMILISNRSE